MSFMADTGSFDWMVARDLANTIICPLCSAGIGEVCHSPSLEDGRPIALEFYAAHTQRLDAAIDAAKEVS